MDLHQATQMINWLEEERRKDKAALATLQERAQGLANELAEQSRRIQELQSALTLVQASLSKISQMDRMFEQFKADLIAEMERREDAHQKADREAERLRKVETEGIARAIAEIRKELTRIKPLEDEMPARRAEEQRLSGLAVRLSQRVEDLAARTEERVQTVTYLEEGRRQDNRRIAQLEESGINLAKRLDTLTGKIALLEDNLQRIPPRFEELTRRMQEQDKAFDEMRANDFRRTQEMKAFTEEINKAMASLGDHIAGYQRMQEMAMANQRALEELKELQTRIENRQAETSEMLRITEDRMKKQIEEWQTEQEKRWQRQSLTWYEQWQEHDRVHEPLEARLEKVEQIVAEQTRQFKVLWDGIEETSKLYLSTARQFVEAQQAMLDKGRSTKTFSGGNNRTSPA